MPADGSHSFLNTAREILAPAQYTGGVRWSGLSDDRRWTPTPKAQAAAYAAHLKAKARQEAELAAYIAARKGA